MPTQFQEQTNARAQLAPSFKHHAKKTPRSNRKYAIVAVALLKLMFAYSPPRVDGISGILGSYYDKPKAIFYLLQGEAHDTDLCNSDIVASSPVQLSNPRLYKFAGFSKIWVSTILSYWNHTNYRDHFLGWYERKNPTLRNEHITNLVAWPQLWWQRHKADEGRLAAAKAAQIRLHYISLRVYG